MKVDNYDIKTLTLSIASLTIIILKLVFDLELTSEVESNIIDSTVNFALAMGVLYGIIHNNKKVK